jgi:hypothetical protein
MLTTVLDILADEDAPPSSKTHVERGTGRQHLRFQHLQTSQKAIELALKTERAHSKVLKWHSEP